MRQFKSDYSYMLFGKLILLQERSPHTFGETYFIIEKDDKELLRFSTTINKDLSVHFPNKEDRRIELETIIKNEIGDEFELDIEGIVDIILAK